METKLNNGYVIREMDKQSFYESQKSWRNIVFDEDHSLFPFEYLSEGEKGKIADLGSDLYKDQYKLYLGVFDSEDNFVGWHFGYQENAHVFYMCNSAILEEHRRKGLYSLLLEHTISILVEKGFQVLYSRHSATNNSVIIPKLKTGFIISNLEMDDVFGVMVHLKYFTNKTRRKIMDYRAGQLKPDDELKKLFNL